MLELLISSALLSILLMTTWASYATASRSMASVIGRFDVFLKIIAFRRAFIGAIQSATPYAQVGNSKADFKGESKKLSFTTLSAPFPMPATSPVPISQIHWVEFSKTARDEHAVAYHPYYFLSDAGKDKAKRVVFAELSSWEFGYYDGSAWSTSWDFGIKRKLPQQVRVKYTISGGKRHVADNIVVSLAQEAEPARLQGANPFAGLPGQGQPGQPGMPGQPGGFPGQPGMPSGQPTPFGVAPPIQPTPYGIAPPIQPQR